MLNIKKLHIKKIKIVQQQKKIKMDQQNGVKVANEKNNNNTNDKVSLR